MQLFIFSRDTYINIYYIRVYRALIQDLKTAPSLKENALFINLIIYHAKP